MDPTTIPAGTPGTTELTRSFDRDEGDPSQPASRPDFYPLGMGDHWEYEGLFRVQVLDDDGNVLDDFAIPSESTREITGTEVLFGRGYVLEKEIGVQHSPFEEGPRTWIYWHRYRQDKSGLYEANVSIVDPPGAQPVTGTVRSVSNPSIPLSLAHVPERHRAAFQAALQRVEERRARLRAALGQVSRGSGGPLDSELTRLRYPLHSGATWKILNDPDLVVDGLVEKHEVLDLPAGRFPSWRIRILWEISDPPDTILVWYGSSGYLRLFAHIRGEATDPNGNHVGWVVSDETEVLTSLELAGQPARHSRSAVPVQRP